MNETPAENTQIESIVPTSNETESPKKDGKGRIYMFGSAVVLLLLMIGGAFLMQNENSNEISKPIVEETKPMENSAFDQITPIEEVDEIIEPAKTGFEDNGDGTVTDHDTGLTWIKGVDEKISYLQSMEKKATIFAGQSDWRVPSIKELYSLMDFNGIDPDPKATSSNNLKPFIDTNFFDFEYGDTSKGDRIIDSQWITNNIYTAKVMNNEQCFFGVNFADGRIKCYPTNNPKNNGYFLRRVKGEPYGINEFVDNKDGTITDISSELTWQKSDSLEPMGWNDALAYCKNLSLAGKTDWRAPTAKELQYIVDYSRSPDATNSPAVDPIFESTQITNEAGQKDWGFYWTSDTHKQAAGKVENAVYVAFGRALGNMGQGWIDVHGAGAQRSDPKEGNIEDFPTALGPQGDVRRLHNFVRCVTE